MANEEPDPKRLALQALLEEISGYAEPDVHFQPPPNVELEYPCIIYKRDDAKTEHADNRPYRFTQRYQVMVISKKPDNPVLAKIAALPLCSYSRFYTAENLNHDVYNLFY